MRPRDYADMGYCVGTDKEAGIAETLFALSGVLNNSNYKGSSYKGSSTKRGCSPKAIKARRKKNKNKKTHRI